MRGTKFTIIRYSFRRPEREDHFSRRNKGVRWWEKGGRPETPHTGRYAGFLLTVVVHAADIQDRDGGILVLEKIMVAFSKLKLIWVDGGYRGEFIALAKILFNRTIKVILRTDNKKGFKVLPKRWIVERTFFWISNYRRNSKDYERLPESSEAIVYISMIHLMIRRV